MTPDAIPEYDELTLRIHPAGDDTYRVFASAAGGGRATGSFRRPISPEQLEDFVDKLTRSVRAYRSSEMENAKQIGIALFEHVMDGEIGHVYQGARQVAQSKGRGLRISLSMTEAPELLEIPWELLYDPGRRRFLSQSILSPIVRSLDHPSPPAAATVTFPVQVLALVSSPRGLPSLNVAAERAKLEEALCPLVRTGLVRLEWLKFGTFSALERRISDRDRLHVIHYIGHGTYDKRTEAGMLALEDDDGAVREVTGEELAECMGDELSVRLVVLNACEGTRGSHVDPFSGVAQSLLGAGLPAVVGMQTEITDQAAITFSGRLYTALAQGFPIDAALANARRAIFASGRSVEFGTPVLFMNVADGRIFEISDAPPPPPPDPLELNLHPEPRTVPRGGMVTWHLKIRNVDCAAMFDITARDRTGETRAGPLELEVGAATDCIWTQPVDGSDVDEYVTVVARNSHNQLVDAKARARVEVARRGGRRPTWWPPSKRVLVSGVVAVLLVILVAALALRSGPNPDPQPDVRVFDAETDVPDLDARGDKVAFLASVGAGGATEIRRLDLGSWEDERVVPPALRHIGVDMGLNGARRTELVYSSCSVPTACDLYRKLFRGDERRLPASTDQCSEIRPSMSDGLVLYASEGPACQKKLMLVRANNPDPRRIAGDTGGADLNDSSIVWLSKPEGALVAKTVDAATKVTSQGTLRPPAGQQFGPPVVVEGGYVYFTHGRGSGNFIARVKLPLRAGSEIEHYVPGDDAAEAEELPHFGVTGDTLFVTNYPQPNGEPGSGKIVRVRNPTFESAR